MSNAAPQAPLKIAFITAGAAGMYCGSCMHDNTLARQLMGRGHDVSLMALYTPLRTDEENVTLDRVFYGAINIYLQSKLSFFRHTPRLIDWLLDRPRLLGWAAKLGSSTAASELGDITLATLQGADGPQAKELDRLVAWLRDDLRPDLVHLSQTLMLGLAPRLGEELGVPITCALLGEDIFLDGLREPFHSQVLEIMRRNARQVAAFIAPCQYFADLMGEQLDLDETKIHQVPLGVDNQDFNSPPPTPRPVDRVTLGYLARMCPEKGFHLLLDAFRRLASEDPRLRLEVAGYLGGGDRAYFEEQRRRVAAWGLEDRVRFHGEVDRAGKIRLLHSLDLFSVPSVYSEPKGLSVLEAMAAGVPVVVPEHGAFPEILGATGAGLLVEPGSVDSLVTGLRRLIADPDQRRHLGEQGRRAVEHGAYGASAMAVATLDVFHQVLATGATEVEQELSLGATG